MNTYMNALTAVILDGIAEGDENAVVAAKSRIKVCKARNARILQAAVNAYEGTQAPARKPARKKAPAKVAQEAPAKAAPKAAARKKAQVAPLSPRTVKSRLKAGTMTAAEARQQAWQYRLRKFHNEQVEMTYPQACELFGTVPASAE